MSEGGIYFLVFQNSDAEIAVGGLGIIHFKEGWHIYAGSALGRAGFLRVSRHFSLAEKKDKKPRWHVDYLLLSGAFRLKYAVLGATSERLECVAAKRVDEEHVFGFGCSDCSCESHLFYRKKSPYDELSGILSSLGLFSQRVDADFFMNR